MTELQGKTAVVTGASRGIGYATALELAKRGAHVVAIARTIGGLEELDDAIKQLGGNATLVPLDITETAKLQELGPSLISRFPHIDILVAAAGYLGKLTSVAQSPTEHWTRAMATNATANITLIQTLHPLLKQSPHAQAVFLTADEKIMGKAYWGFYGASKAALKVFVESYAAENPEMDISTYTPATTKTRLLDEAFPGLTKAQSPEQTAAEIMETLLKSQKRAA